MDDVDLVALDIIFNINGSSFVFRTYGAPNNNQMETYVFNFSKAGISEAPQFVEVAGVYSNKEIGVAMGEVAVPVTKVYLDDWDAVGVKADKNYLKREIIEHEIIGEPITGCKSDFVFGEVYSLTNDLNVDGDCFVINVDNVILNLAGYKITGSYSGYGVHITSDNVTVQNGYIDKFERGVFIEGLKEEDNNTIRDNSFFDNNNSVYIWLSNGNYVGGNRMDRGNYSNIYLNRANNNNIENNWVCASPNDIRCEDSSISNYGSGNTFHTVVNCPEVWLGVSGEGYIEC